MKIDEIMKQHYAVISILGMRGCGKTYLASHLQFGDNIKHIYYIDIVGAFRKEMSNIDFIEFDTKATKQAIAKVLDKAAKAGIRELILDVSMLRRDDLLYSVDVICEYLLNNNRPCALVVDEAGDVLEQEHQYYSSELERVIRIGRNRNILFVILISQRPQKIAKHALALSDYYAIFRFVHNLDLEAVRNILGFSAEEFKDTAEQLKKLNVGEYMLTNGFDFNFIKRGVVDGKIERLGGGEGRRGFEHKEFDGTIEGNKQTSGIANEETAGSQGLSNDTGDKPKHGKIVNPKNGRKSYLWILTPARARALKKGREALKRKHEAKHKRRKIRQ